MTDTTPEAVERLTGPDAEAMPDGERLTALVQMCRALSAEVERLMRSPDTGNPLTDAITGWRGERCGDFAAGCPCCEAWAEYDRLKTPVDPAVWQPIDDAPYDTPVTVRVGGMTFGAILRRWASETTDGDPCDQWQALIADEHPPCWTDGACWEINADGYGSREPEAWRTIAAQTQPEDVGALVADAMAEATKAMRKFPQPNYVISKVAEEAGEVVKAAIHCAEGRERPEAVRGEIVQCMAMLIRLYLEGDQVHGLAALAKQGGEE